MTSINLFADRHKIHFFTDGGHWDGDKQLISIGSKFMALTRYQAGMIYSGTALGRWRLLAEVQRFASSSLLDLVDAFPRMVRNAVERDECLAAVAGIYDNCPVGVAVPIGMDPITLGPGSDVRAPGVPSPTPFDFSRPEESGIAVMIEQRAAFPWAVRGMIDHTIVTGDSILQRTLLRWPENIIPTEVQAGEVKGA